VFPRETPAAGDKPRVLWHNELEMFHTSFLFGSLVWGSIGVGYFIYGKKQQSFSAIAGGILMVVVSYCISSALLMTLACLGIVAAVFSLVKRGY
jgi:hypothetical protein